MVWDKYRGLSAYLEARGGIAGEAFALHTSDPVSIPAPYMIPQASQELSPLHKAKDTCWTSPNVS